MLKKYIVIVGARPNFVKIAPIFHRLKEFPELSLTLVHTGQHFDEKMSDIFFRQMGIPNPDINLDNGKLSSSDRIGRTVKDLKKFLGDSPYDGVIVLGDIDSTLAGAIAASCMNKKLIHIESGLRSNDRRMPEEMNRVVVDHLSDMLFVTEQSAVDNLLREGVDSEKIFLVGNVMVESIELFKHIFKESDLLDKLSLSSGEYVVATIHRVENTSDRNLLEKILTTLNLVAQSHKVVFPIHPGTRDKISAYHLESLLEPLLTIEPVGYIDFMKLVIESKGVLTDSGGIQEETSHLGIPCCTLRDNTERPVTLELGTNKLFPINDLDYLSVLEHLNRTDFLASNIPFWDSGVSKRILELL